MAEAPPTYESLFQATTPESLADQPQIATICIDGVAVTVTQDRIFANDDTRLAFYQHMDLLVVCPLDNGPPVLVNDTAVFAKATRLLGVSNCYDSPNILCSSPDHVLNPARVIRLPAVDGSLRYTTTTSHCLNVVCKNMGTAFLDISSRVHMSVFALGGSVVFANTFGSYNLDLFASDYPRGAARSQGGIIRFRETLCYQTLDAFASGGSFISACSNFVHRFVDLMPAYRMLEMNETADIDLGTSSTDCGVVPRRDEMYIGAERDSHPPGLSGRVRNRYESKNDVFN